MLDLEVQPERSLGNEQWEFLLGMPFYQAIYILRKQDTIIRGVQVWYGDQNPLFTDLVINLTQDGVRLIFDSNSQQLKIIEVYNLSKVKLRYCGSVFNSLTVFPTLDQIDNSFGATHPGVYHSEKQLFVLNFRGLSFEFPVDSKCEPRYTHGIGAIQFRAGTSPVVAKMYIYAGNSLDDTRPPSLPLSCFHGNAYLEKLEVILEHNVTKALKFFLVSEGNGPSKVSDVKKVAIERTVSFSNTCQDVTSALGCPSKVYYKDEDKMKIHSPVALQKAKSHRSDYFFNYFTLGMDILFDAYTHRVKKFILHSNFPGHYNFNMYYRCKFYIPIDVLVPSKSKPEDHKEADLTIRRVDLRYNTKWHAVQEFLISSDRKPVVLNRASTTNTTNPFGSTFCFGFRNMIFEVMPNDHIASVTICMPNT